MTSKPFLLLKNNHSLLSNTIINYRKTVKNDNKMKFNNIGVRIGENVKLGKNVRLGDYVTIYDNTTIGDNTVICEHSVIGEPLSGYYRDPNYENPATYIGGNSIIRTHCTVYAGNHIGEGFSSGHYMILREHNKIGINCSVGNTSEFHGYVTIGDYCRLHSKVSLGKQAKFGNFIYMGPYCGTAEDPLPPSLICDAPVVGDFTYITVYVCILSGVRVGKCCLLGAKSNLVTNTIIPDYSITIGSPAKRVMDIRDFKSQYNEYQQYYPWMYNFDRGTPWQGMDFDKWAKANDVEVERFK